MPKGLEIKFSFHHVSVKDPPKGEDLISLALEVEKAALFKKYPQAEAFSDRLVTRERIVDLPTLVDICQKEECERNPDRNTLYQSLRQAGVPASCFRDFWSFIDKERWPRYFDPTLPAPLLHIEKADIALFSDDDPRVRRYVLLNGARNLADIDLAILAFVQERPTLDQDIWSQFFATNMERDVFERVEQKYSDSLDEGKLKQAKKTIRDNLSSGESSFVPAGAMVFGMHSGQNENNAFFWVGWQLQRDTIAYLAEPVADEIYRMFKSRLFVSQGFHRESTKWVAEHLRRAKTFYGDLGLASAEQTFEEFFNGTVPHLFYDKLIAPRVQDINPFPYGEKPISGEVALERYLNSVVAGGKK